MTRTLACALASCVAMAAAAACGQQPAQPVAGSYTISGTVVNEQSGQPLPRATMTLTDTTARLTVAETETDEDGNFRFDHLPAGRFRLTARKRGYVTEAFQEHDPGVATAIVTGQGKLSTGLRFTLKQQAALFGHISEDSGDPVPDARITLFRKGESEGLEKMVRAGAGVANESGDYEIAHLSPGSYYLCVAGTPWYARRMNIQEQGEDAPRSPLDVAYATTCYPGTTDPAEAEPVQLKPGDRVELPVTLHPTPAVHVVLHLADDAQEHRFGMPSFRTEVFGSSDYAQPSGVSVQRSGDPQHPQLTLIASVAPGQYDVVFHGQDGQPGRTVPLDAGADSVSVDPAAATQQSGITGKAAMANGGELPRLTTVWLMPASGDGHGSAVSPAGEFRIDSLPPGDYRVRVESRQGRLGVAQMTAQGATVHQGVLTVGSDPATLTLSLVQGSSTVSGVVQRGKVPLSGAFVLLVPQDRHTPPLPNQSDSDGSFEYRNVLAGAYTLVAIEDGWTLDWGSRDVLGHYLAGGEKFTVPDGPHELSPPAPLQVQAKQR